MTCSNPIIFSSVYSNSRIKTETNSRSTFYQRINKYLKEINFNLFAMEKNL